MRPQFGKLLQSLTKLFYFLTLSLNFFQQCTSNSVWVLGIKVHDYKKGVCKQACFVNGESNTCSLYDAYILHVILSEKAL